jgi:VIT1/CCC1 family predicted Fe2+/Mn2+ transporter
VQAYTADGLLGLLHEGWQIVIAVCLLAITAVGLARLVGRGPTRMTNGVFVTGFLIIAITVVGTVAVSCSGGADGGHASQRPNR